MGLAEMLHSEVATVEQQQWDMTVSTDMIASKGDAANYSLFQAPIDATVSRPFPSTVIPE